MILTHLLPQDNKCPFCFYDLRNYFSCDDCSYYYYDDAVVLSTEHFRIVIYFNSSLLIISKFYTSSNYKISLNQEDFINFDWRSKDLDQKLDLLYFYN